MKKGKMKKNQYVLFTLGALVIGVAAFFGGTRYQLNKNNLARNNRGNFQGQGLQKTGQQGGAGAMGQRGGGLIGGEITNKDGQSLTVKMNDGSTKIVLVASSTAYKKSTDSTANDLKVGDKVTVIGATNNDGSVTASTVNIGEIMAPRQGGAAQVSPTFVK